MAASDARLSNLYVESLDQSDSEARLANLYVESLNQSASEARLSLIVIQVMSYPGSAGSDGSVHVGRLALGGGVS